jgi:capsule polysaccharide export protein KpsE/RkpR
VFKNDYNLASTIFQRLKAEEAIARQQARNRLAKNIRMIWSERAFLVRMSVLGLIFGAVVALLIPSRYTSTTRLMPPDSPPGSSLAMAVASMTASSGAGGLGAMAGNLVGLRSTSDVFAGILSSRTIQNHIVDQFNLKDVYGVSGMAAARSQLAAHASFTIDRKTEMITISVSDHSPQRAAALAGAFTEQLNKLVSEMSTSSARRERIFLEARLSQVNQDLENAEKEFSQFSSKNNAIDIQEQGRQMLDVAGNLQGQLMFAQSELEGLRQIYSDSNIRVRTLKARIAELQSQLEKLGGEKRSVKVGPDTEAADLYPSLRKLPLLGVAYADLYRRTRVQEAIFQVLTQEYEVAKLQEAREIPTVKVLDPPEVPENKDFPPRRLIVMSTTGLAFFGGTIVLLASKSWNEKNPEDLSKAVVSEIWLDLKNRRFLNSTSNGSENPENASSHLVHRDRSILSFFGWNNGARNGQGHNPPANYDSEDDSYKKEAS